GFKDRPLDGMMVNWIPLRQITLHPGTGLDVERAVTLINEGRVPTAELLGETIPLERFGEALALLDRRVPGRDAVRLSLQIS
ncbi:MAG: alcohol dehydrogenase, partial [Acidimicrobiales bacterium]